MHQEAFRPDHVRAEAAADELEPAAIAGNTTNLKRLLIVLIVAGVGLGGWKLLASRSIWLNDVDEALLIAQASGKPMLVFFTADWCPPCRQLKSGPLKDPQVKSYLVENYVPVKVDLTDRSGPGAMSAAQTGVTGIPTMILYDTQGRETDRFIGGEIVEWLASGDP